MLSNKIVREPNILFVPKTRRRKRRLLRIIVFLVAIIALIVFFIALVNDTSAKYSFF